MLVGVERGAGDFPVPGVSQVRMYLMHSRG